MAVESEIGPEQVLGFLEEWSGLEKEELILGVSAIHLFRNNSPFQKFTFHKVHYKSLIIFQGQLSIIFTFSMEN